MLDASNCTPINWSRSQQPLLMVVVDTEAEFDWIKSKSRKARGVSSVKNQRLAHQLYGRYGIKPTYVVDFPVSDAPEGYEPIRELLMQQKCEIGAHLQPWDTPPFSEEITEYNSYPGNLPRGLESAKLAVLTETIERNLGQRPRIYKAGRYGVGPATADVLAELAYEIDLSVVPRTDLSRQFGPDFRRCGPSPYWFGRDRRMIEIPLSVGFTGLLARFGVPIYHLSSAEELKSLRMQGLLARLHLLDRITLTPEGIEFSELRRLTRALLRAGHRVFSLTYHSPSLEPGNTPYVRTDTELRAFMDRLDRYFEFFFGTIGGRAVTPFEVKAIAEQQRVPEQRCASVAVS
jgi:hypothetical protein